MKLSRAFSVQEIATLIGADIIEGNSKHITGINEIHKVVEGDLSFVDFHKYYDACLNSAASVVLINKADVENPQEKTLLVSDNPIGDYNKLVQHFRPFQPMTSTIAADAQIGSSSIIQPGVVIGNKVTIGEHCVIHPNVTICDHTVIGDHVVIQANSVIGGDAFYYKRRPEGYDRMLSCGRAIIHDRAEIGVGCTIDRGVSGNTIIGEGSKLDNQVHVGHGVEIGRNCIIAAQVGIAGKTIIEDNVMIWGQVGIGKGLRIGEGAVLMAQSGVSKSVEGGKTYMGFLARDAREVLREMAMVRQLPKIWGKLKKFLNQ